MKICPFKAGDYVLYKPSFEGRGRSMMTDLQELIPGKKYKVVQVVDALYVVLEGFESSPTGGLAWVEFEEAK